MFVYKVVLTTEVIVEFEEHPANEEIREKAVAARGTVIDCEFKRIFDGQPV